MSDTASDLKLPYRSPVSEFVRADSQAQPTGSSGACRATATRVTSPDLPSAPVTRFRCSIGSVIASSANEITAISISYPTIASTSDSVAGRIR